MAQTFSLIHKMSMQNRRHELKQAYADWKDTIAEKYLQMFLWQIGVPEFEARGWLSKTDKYLKDKDINDVLLKQEDWYEIVELIIGMEYWPIGHKFPAVGHVYDTQYRWCSYDDGPRILSVSGLKEPYNSSFRHPKVTRGDYYVLHESQWEKELSYGLRLFSVDGRLKEKMHSWGDIRLCFNDELEGVHYRGSKCFGTLFAAELSTDNYKTLKEGRRPDV